jgi:pilus assembly protein CpaE
VATKVRLVIVDDVQESRDNVERLLRFEPDIEIVGKASGGREAIDMVLAKQPTVVLMDVNMPDIDGIEATKAIMARRPNTGVIMMSVLNEPDVLRRSMLAGAREYLVKPFSLDELLTSVHMVHEMVKLLPTAAQQQTAPAMSTPATAERPAGKAHVVSFVGSKGGVGRSLLACNFAVTLRELTGKAVALVDANTSFGDVAVMMNITDGKTIADAVQFQNQIDVDLLQTILQEHSSGVRLLLAPTSPQDAEMVTAEILRDSVAVVAQLVDYVVIDTRPGFDDLNLSMYDLSDLLMLVVTMDMAAIKDAKQFLEIADLLGYSSSRVRVVLNRSNTQSGIPAAEIGESLRRDLVAEIPEELGPVLRSINEGVPLVTGAGDSKAALEIRRLAATCLREISPEGAAGLNGDALERRSSLVGRLRVALRSSS